MGEALISTFTVDAILFDMDGTLVDSTAGVEGAWATFKQTYHGIDIHQILQTSHGIRTVDNLKVHCGITDPDELEREAQRFEEAIVSSSTVDGRAGIVILPGVETIMESLNSIPKTSKAKWAICTSATRAYASQAVQIASISPPEVFVTSEDVQKGKPHPDPYLLGAKLCGVDPSHCLVVEDAPSGIRSGKAAGCITIGLRTTHPQEQVQAAGADYVVQDLSKVSVKFTGDNLEISINQA